MSVHLAPDLQVTHAFLDVLDPGGVFTFQTFADDKLRGADFLPKVFHGTLKKHALALERAQQQGAGAYVMVNEGDGAGRKAKNVTRVRAHFLDLDGAPLQPVLDASLQPHILVESSPKKWHAYWRVEDCPLDKFKERQHALASRFGGDMAVCDLPRVMRLPGFWHLKGEPFQTRLVNTIF